MVEYRPVPSSATVIAMLPPMARHILRCRKEQRAAASTLLGLDLPDRAYGSTSCGRRHALWLGPDEWLVLGDSVPPAADREWMGIRASFVDVSHRQLAIGMSGADVEACLASGCPLDLAIASFPVGACTRTVFHKAEIILWRTASDRFHVEVWRSFAPYVLLLLTDDR